MLRVNEKLLRESLSELKRCDQELYNRSELIEKTLYTLNQNSALEEEMMRLTRILSNTKMIQYKIESMTRVLDYAMFEYERCENMIVSQCEQTLFYQKNRFRFDQVVFNVPFSDRIGWKKGV